MHALILALLLAAPQPSVTISSATTGIVALDLADTLTSNTINMEASKITNQLDLTVSAVPGTSLIVHVQCFESQSGSVWSEITICDGASPSACIPDVRLYTFADYAGSTKQITSRWFITKKFTRCVLDDPADGTGTATLTGARSWQ